MENEKERKRIELMKKENDEMSPIRNKFNMTQNFNQNFLIPQKLRNKSTGLFKVEAAQKDVEKSGTLPPRPNRSGLRNSRGSLANQSHSHSRQIPSLGNTRQSFDPNASHRHSSYFRSGGKSRDVTPKKTREQEELEIQNSITRNEAK